ncbi:hypothetical protein AGMMS49587_12090 [Spirochaetia bacterium]|nr:hypothetical protein AGMMS49587_12090 [Spirochaetia bacterium]
MEGTAGDKPSVGYHGTHRDTAKLIMCSNEFRCSIGNEHWLGKGIYFYLEKSDAILWAAANQKDPAVLSVDITVSDDAWLDYDAPAPGSGKTYYGVIAEQFEEKFSRRLDPQKGQQNQCAIAEYIWEKYPSIMLLVAKFPYQRRKFPFVKDWRPLRREMCARDNSLISNISLCDIH